MIIVLLAALAQVQVQAQEGTTSPANKTGFYLSPTSRVS